jgi:hypothetical protein
MRTVRTVSAPAFSGALASVLELKLIDGLVFGLEFVAEQDVIAPEHQRTLYAPA